MKTYLIFFGSSDGFEFVPYEVSSGDCDGFKSRFKNFDQLDPKFIITDKLENQPVYAKYRIEFSGVALSLLKTYQCAQSSISSRISGSNIGIAFVSEKDLSFDRTNITLVQEIQNDFCQQALNGNRFKDKSFIEIADQLFKKYKDRLNEISFDSDKVNTGQLQGNAVFVTSEINEQKVGTINKRSSGYLRFYLCSDLSHAERSLQSKPFSLFVEHKNEFLIYKDYLEAIKPPVVKSESISRPINTGGSVKSSNGSRDLEHEIRKLEERISKANKFIDKQSAKIRTLQYSLIASILFFLGSFLYTYFLSEENVKVDSKVVTETVEVNPVKDMISSKDTVTMRKLIEFLVKYNDLCKKDTVVDSLLKDTSFIELNKKIHIQ